MPWTIPRHLLRAEQSRVTVRHFSILDNGERQGAWTWIHWILRVGVAGEFIGQGREVGRLVVERMASDIPAP